MRPSSPSSAMPTSIFGRTVGPRSSHAAPHRQSGLDIRSTHGSAVSSSGSRVANRFFTGGWGVARGPGFFGCVRVAATAAGCKPAVPDFAGSSPAASTTSSADRVGRQPQSMHPERAGVLVNSRTSRRPGDVRRSGARARSQFRGNLAIARIPYTRRASLASATELSFPPTDRRWRLTLRP